MLSSVEDLLRTIETVYKDRPLPRAFGLLSAARGVMRDEDPAELARTLKTTSKHLLKIAGSGDPIQMLFGVQLLSDEVDISFAKRRQGLGQMLLGAIAERAFEGIYKEHLGAEELHLEDDRVGNTETDYRVLDREKRPVFRLNIKFHGTLFNNAKSMVGLDPEDCFALATYKVYQGMQKQRVEELPYVFAIVSVRGLSAESVGAVMPDDYVHLAAFGFASSMTGKRQLEDSIVRHLIEDPQADALASEVRGYIQRVRDAEWRVMSAKKADDLLRRLLFERVYAVRQRSVAKTQVNMHYSLSSDLTALSEFLAMWKSRGPQGLGTILERGRV